MTRILIVLIVLFCGKSVDAQSGRLLTGRGGADFSEADRRAEIERKRFEWEKRVPVGVPGAKIDFLDKADVIEDAKEGDIVNLHRVDLRISQITGKQSFMATSSFKDDFITYAFFGVDTKDLSEGSKIRIISPMIRTKNYTFETVVGAAKTVKCFRFFTEAEREKAKELEAKFAAEQKQKEREMFEKANPLYSLTNGESFRGEFIKILKGKYQFRNADQAIVEYELDQFTNESRKQVLEEVKKARRK